MNSTKMLLATAAALTLASVAIPAGATPTTTSKIKPVFVSKDQKSFDAIRKGYEDHSFSFKSIVTPLSSPYKVDGVTFASAGLYGVDPKLAGVTPYIASTKDLTVSFNGPVLGLFLKSVTQSQTIDFTVNGTTTGSIFLAKGVSTFLGFDNLGASSSITAFFDLTKCDGPIEVLGFQTAVPEAATWAMMMVGLGVVGTALRRRPKVATRASFA